MYQVLNLSLVSYAAQVCVYKLLYVFEIVAAEKDEKIKKKVPQLIHTCVFCCCRMTACQPHFGRTRNQKSVNRSTIIKF